LPFIDQDILVAIAGHIVEVYHKWRWMWQERRTAMDAGQKVKIRLTEFSELIDIGISGQVG
jgi:hypothetical protein